MCASNEDLTKQQSLFMWYVLCFPHLFLLMLLLQLQLLMLVAEYYTTIVLLRYGHRTRNDTVICVAECTLRNKLLFMPISQPCNINIVFICPSNSHYRLNDGHYGHSSSLCVCVIFCCCCPILFLHSQSISTLLHNMRHTQ